MAQSELSRLRKNLKQKIKYYNNKGYNIDPSFVDDLAIEDFDKYTGKYLTEDVFYEQEEEREQDEYYEFPDDYDIILDEFRKSYSKYDFEKTADARNALDRWLEMLIEQKGKGDTKLGKKIVAKMIDDARADGVDITPQEMYSNRLSNKLHQFMEYLPDDFAMGSFELDQLMEYVEYGSGWGDIE